MIGNEPVLDIKGLQISFKQYDRGFKQRQLDVIKNLDVSVPAGKVVAVVGSSGSGKSLLAHAVMGILPYNASVSGDIQYCGEPLTKKKIEQLRGNEIVIVPQSTSYLDPLMKIGKQICKGKTDKETNSKLDRIFQEYELDLGVKELYPFELSGGMTRRVMISTALIENPKLVIADEPTPGLHISVAKRAMEHFRDIANKGAGVLVITHDLELAMSTADQITVFYAGSTIEEAPVENFQREELLNHPYTKALWRALPQNGFQFIGGTQPYVKDMPQGCPFGPRCERCTEECRKGIIPWQTVGNGRVRCLHI